MIIVVVAADFASIFEAYLLEAICFQVGRLDSRIDFHVKVPIVFPIVIGTFEKIMSSGWMVRSLLKVNLSAILSIGLESFAKNRVERLFKPLSIEKVSQFGTHEMFHSFCRVCGLSCPVHV